MVLGAELDWAFPPPLGVLALPLASVPAPVVRLAFPLALVPASSFAIAGLSIALPLGTTEPFQIGPLLGSYRWTWCIRHLRPVVRVQMSSNGLECLRSSTTLFAAARCAFRNCSN